MSPEDTRGVRGGWVTSGSRSPEERFAMRYLAASVFAGLIFVIGLTLIGVTPGRAVLALCAAFVLLELACVLYLGRRSWEGPRASWLRSG